MRPWCALPALPALIRVALRHLLLQSRIALRNLREGSAVTQDSPVFVVGCGHSGTTLLISILNTHPAIRAYQGEANLLHPRHGRSEIVDWYQEQRRGMDADARLAEKTASNVRYLRRLFALFPNARVIVVLRDGRDVICSLRERTGRLPGAIVRWLHDTKLGLAWRSDGRVRHVRYEDLVTDFDATLEGVCGFLGVAYRPELRDFHRSDYQYAADKADEKAMEHGQRRESQARSPLFDGRGKWRGCFRPGELCQVMTVAGRRLKALGYLDEDPVSGPSE